MKTLTISGMHCDACKKLISMELEDAGLDQHVASIEVEGDNKGTLTLKDGVDEGIEQKVRETVNGMEGYTVE